MIFLFVILILSVQAHEPSIMFSPAEKEALDHVLTQAIPEKQHKKRKGNQIRLDGIIYQSPKCWKVWINDVVYEPGQACSCFTIDTVTPESIVISANKNKITLKIGCVYEEGP